MQSLTGFTILQSSSCLLPEYQDKTSTKVSVFYDLGVNNQV